MDEATADMTAEAVVPLAVVEQAVRFPEDEVVLVSEAIRDLGGQLVRL